MVPPNADVPSKRSLFPELLSDLPPIVNGFVSDVRRPARMPLTRDRNRSKIAQLQFPGPRMNQFALLSGVAFGAYLLLGGHAVLVDPRSRTNRMLGWMSACLALWALSIVFVSTAPNEAVARDWARVGALGWTLFPPFVLQFSWALTRGGRAMHPWAAVVAFAPFVGTLAYQHAFVLEDRARFVQTTLGWVPTYPDFLWGFFLFRLCYEIGRAHV